MDFSSASTLGQKFPFSGFDSAGLASDKSLGQAHKVPSKSPAAPPSAVKYESRADLTFKQTQSYLADQSWDDLKLIESNGAHFKYLLRSTVFIYFKNYYTSLILTFVKWVVWVIGKRLTMHGNKNTVVNHHIT